MMTLITNFKVHQKLSALLFIIFLVPQINAQTTSWTGASNTNWTTSGNWTNGVPNQNTHAVIGDASFTGSNQPRLNSGTLRCKSLTLGNGAIASTLTIARNLVVYGNVLIGANGTITHNTNKRITLEGNWTNNGTYSATNNGARVTFSGSAVTLSGATTFRDLRINAGCTVTLAANITVNSDMDCYGILNPTASYTVGGSADLDVERDGSIEVYTSTFAGNYTISQVDINARGEVHYASSSLTQTVSSAYKYGILRISGGSTKELAANLPDLHSGGSTRGRVYVDEGIFDIKSYTCDRSASGGVFNVAADAELWIGGTNTFPANYLTVTLATSSTVNYYGNDQTVEDHDYGNLTLGGTSGSVTKTMPSTTLDVFGELLIEIGGADDVTAIAGNTINVYNNVTIEEDCTLGGASYSHSFDADWDNEGTFTGGTSTVNFTGVGATLSGSGSHNFNNINFTESGITATSGTTLTVSGDAATTGSGTFTHGSTGVFEMTGTAKTISGSGFNFYDLDISGTITTSDYITVSGDFLTDGTFTATNNAVIMNGSSASIGGTGSITYNTLDITGTVGTAINFTVNENFVVASTSSFIATTGDITFDGTSVFSGTASLYDISVNASKSLQLDANAHLKIGNSFTNAGTFNASTLIPNTVTYNKNGAQSIAAETYYNLVLATGGLKTQGGATSVNNDITINSGVTLDASTYVLSIYRHWINNGTFTASTSDVQFRGSNAGTVTGVTTFNTFTVNKSSSETQILLDDNVIASDIVMTQGNVDTDVNSITTTSGRTGNGIIVGTIIHDHAISGSTTYYFEGPNNGLTFYNPSALNKVTVKVTLGEVTNVNPLDESVTREYDVDIPSGTYDSATMRLHYEDNELNAFVEPFLSIYEYNSGTTWDSLGYDSRDISANYVELEGILDVDGIFMLGGLRNVVRWNGTVSTDWANASNWTTISGLSMANRVPDEDDVARIGDTAFVNQPIVSATDTINVLRFGDTKAATLSLSGGNLEIIGSARGNWSTNRSHKIDVGDDTLIVGTTLTLSDGINSHDIELEINGGLADIQYDLVQQGTGTVTFDGTGNLKIGHDYEYISGTFTPDLGTVTYGGIVNQTIAPLSYYNLAIDKTTARARLESPTIILNNLTTSTGGELALLDTTTVTNDMTVGSSTEVLEFNSQVYVGGDWSNSGTFTVTGGTVEFNGSGNQSVDANTFNNLSVNKSGGTLTLTGNLVVDNNLSLLLGTMDVSTYTANRGTEGGDLRIDSAASLLVGGANNFPDNFITTAIDTHSNVTYNGTVDQTVLPITYGNLTFANGSPNEKILDASCKVLNDITINSGAIFAPDTSTINLFGNLTNSGTINPGSSTLILNGSSKTINGSTHLNNLSVILGSYTVTSGTTDMDGNLFIESTGSLNFGTNTAILDGNLTNSGSLTSNGIATFTGTRTQYISLISAITSSSTGVINLNGTVAPVISSTSSPSFATVNVNNTAGVTPSVPWSVIVALNIDANSSFNAGAFTHTIYGNLTNDGDLYSTGKLFFSPGAPYSASSTVQLLGDTFSSTGEVEFGGTAPLTITGNAPNFGKVIISNSHANGITATGSWDIENDLQINNGSEFKAGTSTTHLLEGNLVNNGTLTGETSKIIFEGDTVFIDGVGSNNFEDIQIDTLSILTLNSDIKVYSDFINDGEFVSSDANVDFTGTAAGTISGKNGSVTFDDLETTKTGGASTTLSIPVTIANSLTMTSGYFNTDATNLLIVADDASSTPGNDTSFVDGPMKKTGNDTFVYPLGDGSVWARLQISAPSVATDEFTAEYFFTGYTDTTTMATTPTPMLNNVSTLEYWTCDRTAGTSNVKVTLHWEDNDRSGISGPSSDLVVARWNGSAWENAGQSAATGTSTGYVASNSVTSFSPFTFGSTSGINNVLPVDLLYFTARLNENQMVDLNWRTASEINNDFFTVERSQNGLDFDLVTEVKSKGNTNRENSYEALDSNPLYGVSYYRLRQTDFNGKFKYSQKISVYNEKLTSEINIFPNPTEGIIHIQSSHKGAEIKVFSSYGQLIDNYNTDDDLSKLDMTEYSSGVYYIHVVVNGDVQLFEVMKK
jgi:fibronectin-binding autotransporter adhesin